MIGSCDGADMEKPLLCLVIEVTVSHEGTHLVRLRSGDEAMDFGPLNIHDLPLILTALLPETASAPAVATPRP